MTDERTPLSERIRAETNSYHERGLYGAWADGVAALEQERDELEAYLMETLSQLDDCKLGYIDCLKSRSFELRRLEQEVERLRAAIRDAIADCPRSDCPDCDGLRRALADTEGE